MPSIFDDENEQDVLKPKTPKPSLEEETGTVQEEPQVFKPMESIAAPAEDAADSGQILEPGEPVNRGFDPQPMQRLADIDPRAILAPPEKLQPFTAIKSSMRDKSLEVIGVKWADHKDEKESPKPLFDNDVGFYEIDYDPMNEQGRARGTVGVQAANVFGRQFTREELEKDSEGRKIIQMMEGIRTGEYREQGFLKGLSDFDRSNIPWVGIAMDVGTGVSDAIDISDTMRKMQRGEAVTDHEALSVRRFMLQQEIESGRSFGYGVGSVIRQSPTFMVEMALSGKMIAASSAVGGAVGAGIGLLTPVPGDEAVLAAGGAKVGAAVGTAIFGLGIWGKKLIGKVGAKLAGKAAARAAVADIGKFASREAAQGFALGEALAIRRAAGKSFFTKEAKEAVMAEVRQKLGAEASDAAVRKAANFEVYRRAAANAASVTLDGKAVDVGLATRIAVGGDEANLLQGEYRRVVEQTLLRAAGVSDESAKGMGYFAARRKMREGYAKLLAEDENFMQKIRDDFVNGTLTSFDNAAYKDLYATLMRGSREAMGGAGRDLVAGSMSGVTGQIIAGENSYARAVTNALIDNQIKSLALKYGGKGFVNGIERAARFVGEHAANGVLRWDESAFGGSIGTIARSGAVHGGKMAALKDAIGIAMVEAPVRGAMQLGVQAPLWPVYAAASGHNPLDFTIRGQLGNQATALRTGDEELMDNARAVAFGSLLVEYASENAGRGFNAAMGGIVAPAWRKTFLAKPTARLGSYMNQKLNAMFGLTEMMQPAHNERLAGFVTRTLKTRLGNMGEGALADGIVAQDIKKIVQTRSFNGIADSTRRALDRAGFRNANKMIRDSVAAQKWRTATQFMVADFMLRKGITPQKFNAMLERVGYDGVIAEMAEERYGGFLQGLFGLNDNPSDETWADRWRAAMEGLFPDKRQLLTEAIAFSVPSIASMSMQSLYRSIGAGSGGMQDLRESVATLRSAQSARGTVSIPGVTAEYAQQLREWKARLDGLQEQTLGKTEDNRRTIRTRVGERLAGDTAFLDELDEQAQGRLAPLRDARTDEERDHFVDELVDDLLKARDHKTLREQLAAVNAQELLGEDGVAAVENEWRKQQNHQFAADDAREQAISGAAGEFARMLRDAPRFTGDVDVSDIVSDITVQLGGTRSDTGVLGGAARRGGEGLDSGLNLFSEDLLDQVAASMATIGKQMHSAERGIGADLSLGRRLAMHTVGVVDGLFSGNWALASASPVQYMYEDAGLPRSLMGKLRKEYKSSLLVAERQLRESGERITEQRMEEVADEIFSQRTRDFAASYLAASNVLAVSRSDISEAASRVVGYRNRRQDGTFSYTKADGTAGYATSFRDAEFLASHRQDMLDAQKDIMQMLAETAASGILATNDHAGMGHRASMALNLTRAMQYGSALSKDERVRHAELMAAIGELPVFRHLHKVFDISGMSQEYNDVVNSGFFGRLVDTDVIADIDAGPDATLSPEQLADVATMMGRDMTLYTEQENQAAVKQFVRQVQAVVESGLDARYEDRTGGNRPLSVVRDAAGFTVMFEETAGGRVVSNHYATRAEVREALDAAGFDTIDKRVVMTTNRSIVFDDALSGALFLNQDNLEAARAELLRHMGVEEGSVSEEMLPFMLRRDPGNGNRMGYTDVQTGAFVDVTTDEGRRKAAEDTKALIEAADRADRTNDEEDLRAKAIVYGGMLDGAAVRGFERAADRLVRTRGAVDSYEDAAAVALGRPRGYSFRVGALTAGDTLIISRDYDNGVDSEALLRAAIANGLRSGFARTPESDRPVRNLILATMAREFRAAANRIIDRLDAKKDADRIDAIRAAVASVLGEEGTSVTFDGLAAITAATAFFTSERGLYEDGNGFMYQPELARIADEAREAEVFPFFLSEMDQLLGGNGFFTEEAASSAGLARLRDAFSPSGEQVRNSRRSAMFDGGAEGATSRVRADNPAMGVLRWTEQGILNGTVEHVVDRDTAFSDVSSFLSRIAGSCHEVAGGFKRVHGAAPASTEDAYRRLHASELGGNTRASISGAALGSDDSVDAGERGVTAALSRAASNSATNTRTPTPREITSRTAVSLARNFLFMVPDGATAASIRAVRSRLDAFLESRGVSDADRAKITHAFSFVAERRTRYGQRADEARAKADTDNEKELEQKTEGGNGDIFLENERRDAFVDNDDLLDCSAQFKYVFPIESTNYTAVLHRTRTELARIRGMLLEEGAAPDSPLVTLADALNVFEAPRTGTAADRIASVYAFDNNEVTDMLLDAAVDGLLERGRVDLAFVFSALRNIPSREGRRVKALRQMSQMSPAGSFYAEQAEDGSFRSASRGSQAARASVDAVRSVLVQPALGALGGRSATDMGTRLSALVNLVNGDQANFDKHGGKAAWFNGATVKELKSLLGQAGTAVPQEAFDFLASLKSVKADQVPALHGRIVEYANAVRERMLGTAAAVERMFGANELVYALRNPAFVEQRVLELESALGGDRAGELLDNWRVELDILQPSDKTISKAINFWLVWPLLRASHVAVGARGPQDFEKLNSAEAATAFVNALSGEISRLATRGFIRNPFRDGSAFGDMKITATSQSPLSRILAAYSHSMPRSTDSLRGRGSGEVERTTLAPASPMPAALAVEDRVLAKLQMPTRREAQESPMATGIVLAPAKDTARKALEIGGVDTLRHPDKNGMHFGNPFNPDTRRANVKVSVKTIKEAVERYESWLRGTTDQDLEPKRRKWIVDQLKSGALVGKPLVYYTDRVQGGDYDGSGEITRYDENTAPHHAHILQKLIAEFAPAGQASAGQSSAGSVLDAYLKNGARFADGSRLTFVALGAKDRLGHIVEPSFVSRVVNSANMDDYVKRNDSTSFRFQLYHGEKPTAYSVQLPGDVANELFKRALAERDADVKKLFPSHVPTTLDLDALAGVEDVRAVGDEKVREQVYRFLYAAVASAARCDQISPKRVQILMSQGTMSASYRDYRYVVKEADGVKSLVREDFAGEPATPGHYILTSLGGGDASAWMGMWMDHGYLVETLRAMSTNPNAVSFKTHGYSLYGSTFQKGQGHDFGIGVPPVERAPDGSFRLGKSRYGRTSNEALLDGQRRMRKRLAGILGLDAAALEPVTAEQFKKLSAEEQAKRYEATQAVDRFFTHSSMRISDHEVDKAGPLSGDAGFVLGEGGILEMSHEKYGTFYFNPGTMEFSDAVEVADGTRRLKSARKIPAFDCAPEVKKGAVSVAWGLAAYMKVATTGDNRALSADECGKVTALYRLPTGAVSKEPVALADSGLFQDYGGRTGDRVEVEDDGDTATFQYFTRGVISQVVANSDAEAECSTAHPYATNAVRDSYLNEVRTKGPASISDIPDVVAAACVNRAVNFSALLVNAPELVDARVERDDELMANLLMNPFDLRERSREFRKKNSVYARAMRLPVFSNHGVLLPSGGKVVKADVFGKKVEIEWAPGVTQYTKDMFRSARAYSEAEAFAFGQARSYGSGAVNVRDDGSFRYGMFLDQEKFDAYMERFGTLFGVDDGAKRVASALGRDAGTAADLASAIRFFRDPANRGTSQTIRDSFAAQEDQTVDGRPRRVDVEYRNVEVAVDAYTAFLGCFTDYTGMYLNDPAHRRLDNLSFDDLFREDGSFDYAAIDRRVATDGDERLFVGGSFFSGSRRPSGNVEAASGLCRASMPTLFADDGTPSPVAIYQLDPLTSYVQGSDTDGDSASIIIHRGRHDDAALDAVRHLATLAESKFNRDGAAVAGDYSGYRRAAREFYDEAKALHPEFFREDGSPSEAFHDAIANLIFRTEVENYRRSKVIHQGWRPENPEGVAASAPVYDMAVLANSSQDPVLDIGAAGRRPVGPDLLNDGRPVGAAVARKYGKKHGISASMSFKAAFRAYVNSVNPEVNSDLLDPVSAANLSDAAADASEARGVMVALQASIEHLGALAANDPRMQDVAPGLLRRRADGYDPLVDFIGHLDGVSNALFDVVKDMFAPRAGWRKEMLTYFVGRLVAHANAAYEKDATVQYDDAWFFTEAVKFIDDCLDLDTFAGRLMYATGDVTGGCADLRARYDLSREDTLFDAALDAAGAERPAYDYARRDFVSWLGSAVKAAVGGRLGRADWDAFAYAVGNAYGDRGLAGSASMAHLRELLANERNALMGTQYTLLAADALMTPVEEAGKRRNAIEKAYEVYKAFDVINTVRLLENSASPDAAFRGDQARLDTYERVSAIDRMVDGKADFSADNRAKALINATTGANMRRIADEMFDPAAEARRIARDLDVLDKHESDGTDSAFLSWAASAGFDVNALSSEDFAAYERARALAEESAERFSVGADLVGQNREMLHHVIGVVAYMHQAKATAALAAVRAALASGGVEGFRREVAKAASAIVGRVLNSDAGTPALRTMAEYVYVDAESGDIRFISKPGSEDSFAVADGLRDMRAFKSSFSFAGVEVPWADFPHLFALHQAVSDTFSGTTDPRVRPNAAAFFGTDYLNFCERWGTGIAKHPASRLLCLVRTAKGSSAYNLAATATLEGEKVTAFDVIESLADARGYRAACSPRPALPSTALQALDIAQDSVLRTDNGFRADGVQFQLTDPIDYHVGDRKGRARKLRNRKAFDTLEGAYNDLVDQVIAAHFGTDGLITGGEVVRSAVDGIKPRGLIRYTGLDEFETMKRILLSTMRGTDGEALKKAVSALDERSLDFSKAVPRTPGVTRTNAPALLAMKEYLARQATQGGGAARASIQGAPDAQIGEGSAVVAQRMKRGDFDVAGRNRGPQAAVTHAMESAFGKWSKTGGARVTRVKRNGRPVNLLKIERRLKTKGGVKTVTTYVTYGEALHADYSDRNYVESLANYLRQRGWAGTADDIVAMPERERDMLAEAFNAQMLGASEPAGAISTNGVALLSGLIRLSDAATFNTLFHEYFHQMYDLLSRQGVLSAEDQAELLKEFDDGSGRFDEEAAADRFARYVTGMADGDSSWMFHEGKAGLKTAFDKIHKTCKAFAEALAAEDASGAPAFMQALITGDVSDRMTERLDAAAERLYDEVEDALLGKEVEFASVRCNHRTPEQVEAAERVRAAALANDAAALKKALADMAALKGPQFEAHLNSPKTMEQGTFDFSEAPVKAAKPKHPDTAVGRMQEFMKTALDRFGVDCVPLGLDGQAEMRRLRDLATWGELPATDVMQLAATARRVIADTAEFLGYKLFEIGADGKTTLTEDGRGFLSDDAVAEMTVRLCRHMNALVAAENRDNPYGAKAVNASADKVYGAMLAEVAKERWVPYARGRIDEASGAFMEAARRLRARADSVDAQDHERAVAMRNDAVNLEILARKVRKAFTETMDGKRLHEVQGFPGTHAETFAYGNLLDGVQQELLSDGRKRYFGGKYSADATAMPEFQSAFDKAAHTLFTVACARSYLRKAGQDFPPVGAAPEVRSDDPAPDPGYLIDEADTTAQMILQSPGAWLAADMMRDFMGVSMRDVMTDHDIKAKTEAANMLANSMDFVFGADCHAGEKVREISFGSSDLGFDKSGIDIHDERLRHSFMRIAPVRGVDPLGMFVRDAKRTGRELSLDDCDTIDFVGQVVKALSCGDGRVVTGIDLPWPNRRTLDTILRNWKTPEELLAGPLSRESVTARVKRYQGETATSDIPFAEGSMPNNIDHLFYRVYEALPVDFQKPVLETLASAILRTAVERGTDTGTAASGDARERLSRDLADLGFAETSRDGRCVLTIPASLAKDVWKSSGAYAKLAEAGRTAGMLNLDYWAARFAAEANSLHEVAARSQFMRSASGRRLTSAANCGMWFHHGSGAHRLNVSRLENAKELFGEKASPDERLAVYHAELMEILVRHSADPKDGALPVGERRAFNVTRDPSGNLRVSGEVTHRQIQYLIRLLSRYGVLVRDGRGRLVTLQKNFNPVDFVLAVQRGEFSFGGGKGLPVKLDADSTVFDFDRAIYALVTQAVADEIAGVGSGIDEFGTKQGLIDAHELASRLERSLGAHDKGRVVALSPVEMFRMSSRLGSSMSASQNLRAMCEEIVTAERYRGAMTQMLQTVGPDGAMNYIVNPTDESARFLPDEYWGALARFTIARNQDVPGIVGYDASKSGIQNMQAVYTSLDTDAARDHMSGKSVRGGRPNAVPVSYSHFENLRGYAADSLFRGILVRNPGPTDSVNALDRTVGGEAMGYMKQLLGMVAVPPSSALMANVVDRAMSYSKACSVGLSAFFAFATRFESPVAASGFWATVLGYTGRTADFARKVGEMTGRAGQTGAFNSDAVFLADILKAISSDDPYVREMRELCDLIGMPLTDPIQNPVTDRQGAIDQDIDKMCRVIERTWGQDGVKYSKRIRAGLRAALHNPSEYAFSNVLNGVKMAVVSQTLRRLREECRDQRRPFDPVRELRKYSPYINAEIGGIDPGRYAFLTPQMQRVLRRSMFSYQWTLGAWVAGTGEVVTDLLFGGHNTTPELRRLAFIRWLRMIGIVKVGVPVFMQMAIKALATCIAAGMGDPDPDDGDDPYGIEAMPWLCFNNEEKIGSLSFDITPLLRLAGSNETMRDIKLKRGAWPYISAVAGGAIGGLITRGPVGMALGAAAGLTAGDLLPVYVGRGKNTTGNRRYYMHFGKQNDEFWRWFTEPWQQATNKLSIPTQKVVEAFFGSTNGSNFGKSFAQKGLADRFFTTNLDPNENAVTNILTSFLPFSAASVAAHPDAGIVGMLGPVQLGASKTYVQKKLVNMLVEFAEDDRHRNPWASQSNHASLELVCKEILDEAALNGVDPKDILTSAIGQAASREYRKLFDALPKDIEDNQFDTKAMTKSLRALARLNRKNQAILQSLAKRYKAAGVDWEKQSDARMAELVRGIVEGQSADPYNWGEPEYKALVDRYSDSSRLDVQSVDVQQDRKGGEAFSNFLATDDVPETLFGIPVVSSGYTQEDLEFFKANPKAAGFYDLGDGGGGEEPPPEEPPPEGGPGPEQGAQEGGNAGPIDAPTLVDEGRPMYFDRDASGKITGYGTTRSIVHEDDGKFFVIPTILDNDDGTARLVGEDDAKGWYSETGEHWGSYATREEADAASEEVHRRHEKLYRKDWNEFIQDHWDEMADSVKRDPGVSALRKLRTGKYPGAWNNPGNVKLGDALYDGESGTHTTEDGRTFLKFKTPQDGLNAMAQVIGQIVRQKIPQEYKAGNLPSDEFTPDNLLKVYAPKKDSNDTDGYASFVAGKLGVDRKAVLDMDDAKQMAGLLEAMTRRDSGHPHADWFRPDDYRNAAAKMSVPAGERKRKGGK